WVYEEEVFGRGRPRAYWWSPDSSRVAFLQIDDTPVPTFPVVDHIPAGQVLEQTPYPRSGDPNPLVKIGVVRAGGSPVQWFDTSKYAAPITSSSRSAGRPTASRWSSRCRTASSPGSTSTSAT